MKTTKEQRDKWQQLSDAASPLWEDSEHGGYPIIIQQRIFSPDPVPLICEMANTDFAREARTAVPALLQDVDELERTRLALGRAHRTLQSLVDAFPALSNCSAEIAVVLADVDGKNASEYIDALEASFDCLVDICDEASYTEDDQAMYVDPARISEAKESFDVVVTARAKVGT